MPPEAPVLTAVGLTRSREPMLDWDPVDGVDHYILEFSPQPDFSDSTTVQEIGPSQYEVPLPLQIGDWFWHVKSVDMAGNESSWSEPDHFQVIFEESCNAVIEKPSLIWPPDGADNVSLIPNLQILPPENIADCDKPLKSRWRISKNPEFQGLEPVDLFLSKPAPENAKWVFYDSNEGWIDFSEHAIFNKKRTMVTLELKDSGYGDNDHTKSKLIVQLKVMF